MGLTTHTHLRSLRLLLPVLCLLLPSCKKQQEILEFQFNSTIEQPGADTPTKTRLVGEQWIYWDLMDQISIKSDKSESDADAECGFLITPNRTEWPDYSGVFVATLPEESKYFMGLFPYSTKNKITPSGSGSSDFTSVIFLPQEQPVSTDTSFDHSVFPMSAWFASDKYPYYLHFHSLGGIVRLQFLNASDADKTLDRIEVSDDSHQLWGSFAVNGYKTENPWLSFASADETYRTLVIKNADGTPISFACTDSLRSLYVVLPAMGAVGAGGENTATQFHLTVTLYTTDGKKCSRSLTVSSRRRAITYTQALHITGWADAASSDNGASERGIVGNGTATRPYKIYSVEDLKYLRNCFDHPVDGKVYVNGKAVDANTQFRIMQNQLVLNNSNWNGHGIRHFKGTIANYAMQQSGSSLGTLVEIVNNSLCPLFGSVDAGGVVEGLSISFTLEGELSVASGHSPLCDTNNNGGIIRNCQVQDNAPFRINTSSGLAGICWYNLGTIEGCGCAAQMENLNGGVAGICYENHNVVKGSYVASPARFVASTSSGAAGVVYTNTGTVQDCYFATSILASNLAMPWAGIVFHNNGKVQKCYIGRTGSIRTTGYSVGGIVNTNNATGTIDQCWSRSPELRGSLVGGIVANMVGGTVSNCYVNDTASLVTLDNSSATPHYAGGLVGRMAAGNVQNSYVYMHQVDNAGIVAAAGGLVGNMVGGTLDRCYAYETTTSTPRLYGQCSGTITNSFLYIGTSQTPTAQTGYEEKNAKDMRSPAVVAALNTLRPEGCLEWESSTATGTFAGLPTHKNAQ